MRRSEPKSCLSWRTELFLHKIICPRCCYNIHCKFKNPDIMAGQRIAEAWKDAKEIFKSPYTVQFLYFLSKFLFFIPMMCYGLTLASLGSLDKRFDVITATDFVNLRAVVFCLLLTCSFCPQQIAFCSSGTSLMKFCLPSTTLCATCWLELSTCTTLQYHWD